MSIAIPLLVAVAMTGWVAVDAERHGRNWVAWAVLVAATSVLGLIAWLVVRRRSRTAPGQLGVRRHIALVLSAFAIVLLTMIVGVFTTTFLVQVARVEGRAMAPTLEDQDRLIVSKLAYQIGEPRRGDIVMLY